MGKAPALQSGSGGMYAGTEKTFRFSYFAAFAARARSERQKLHKLEKVALPLLRYTQAAHPEDAPLPYARAARFSGGAIFS